LGIILPRDLSWADEVNYAVKKPGRHYILQCVCLKREIVNTKSLAYTSLVRPILEYGAACWDLYRKGSYYINRTDLLTLAENLIRGRPEVIIKGEWDNRQEGVSGLLTHITTLQCHPFRKYRGRILVFHRGIRFLNHQMVKKDRVL
jgi:hypothetical protein